MKHQKEISPPSPTSSTLKEPNLIKKAQGTLEGLWGVLVDFVKFLWNAIQYPFRMIRDIYGKAKLYFFVFKRHPFQFIDMEYTPIEDRAIYAEHLDKEGFVTVEHWQKDDLKSYKTITDDLECLEQHLLPTFWAFDQKAKYYQNVFYNHQWLFILGAFITTAAAILTNSTRPLETGEASTFHTIIGAVTIFMSLLTTYASIMTNHNQPRKRWINYRRLAEDLRMTYFQYIAHIEPFNKSDRTKKLRRHVLEIRKKEPTTNG
jgi:hypothetical protein